MAYDSYKPEILANELMTDRNRNCVFANLCYKGPMLGEIKRKGDVLYIAGIGRPTVRSYTGPDISLELKTSYNQALHITEAKYVNVAVDDVDNAQMQGPVFAQEVQQAKEALGRTLDEFLAGFYSSAGNTITNATTTALTILDTLLEAEQKLAEADVPLEEDKFLVVTPAIYRKMQLAKIIYQVDNKEMFGKGFVGQFFNSKVFVSNSIQENSDIDYCMMFSNQAIAMAEQIPASSVERYRPEKAFQDAFKGLHLYGGTVIRPEELVCLPLTPTAEAS